MERCRRCVLTVASPGIFFDAEGICTLCREWDRHRHRLRDYPTLQKLFAEKVDHLRGRFPYDVIVGLSGGKDGAYVAYSLVREYGLKVLAITGDYGFMPNGFARQNAVRVCRELGIDHRFHVLPERLRNKIFSGYLRLPNVVSPCHMCTSILGPLLLTRIAEEANVPLVCWGLDDGQLYGKLHLAHARERIFEYLDSFTGKPQREHIARMMERAAGFMKRLGLTPEELREVLPKGGFLPGSEIPVEHLFYFVHHRNDEEQMKRLLVEQLGWVRPENDRAHDHFDCELKKAVGWTQRRLDCGSVLENVLSFDVRDGKLTREQALERLAADSSPLPISAVVSAAIPATVAAATPVTPPETAPAAASKTAPVTAATTAPPATPISAPNPDLSVTARPFSIDPEAATQSGRDGARPSTLDRYPGERRSVMAAKTDTSLCQDAGASASMKIQATRTACRPYEAYHRHFGISERAFARKVRLLARLAPWYYGLLKPLARVFPESRLLSRLLGLIR